MTRNLHIPRFDKGRRRGFISMSFGQKWVLLPFVSITYLDDNLVGIDQEITKTHFISFPAEINLSHCHLWRSCAHQRSFTWYWVWLEVTMTFRMESL